jgi:exopolysaccharide biosynthesis polyprenyl glycosylphosphotransferase
MGKVVKVALNLHDVASFSKCDFTRLNGIPMLVFHTVSLDPDQILIKRSMDILGGAIGCFITFLLFPFVAIAIKRDSAGPVLFSHLRVGQNMRTIKIYKFRSMVKDAENKKQKLMSQNELNGAVFKITDDPRITRVGKFLRRTSIDELPQFWNVLKGEMSLVGTRPPTPDEVEKYDIWHYRRVSIKPGITGLWQVSGRNRIKDFDEIVKLDLRYIDEWNLWLDIKILLKTLIVVFQKKTAY